MNKTLHTWFLAALIAVYTLTTIGVPVYYHYCGGELETVSALVKAKSCCGAGDNENDGCCKNEMQHFSLKPEFHPAKNLAPDFSLTAIVLPLLPVPAIFQPSIPDCDLFCVRNPHPPNHGALALVRTSVFRI